MVLCLVQQQSAGHGFGTTTPRVRGAWHGSIVSYTTRACLSLLAPNRNKLLSIPTRTDSLVVVVVVVVVVSTNPPHQSRRWWKHTNRNHNHSDLLVAFERVANIKVVVFAVVVPGSGTMAMSGGYCRWEHTEWIEPSPMCETKKMMMTTKTGHRPGRDKWHDAYRPFVAIQMTTTTTTTWRRMRSL